MANRDEPVNGRLSKLSLLKTGNLVLIDAGRLTLWATDTSSTSSLQLRLYDTGNLVLLTSEGKVLRQSFDSPTDTLLPQQLLTRNTKLVSSRSLSNYSSGFYKLFFDDDNLSRLLFDGPEISSVYWPSPWKRPWEDNRSTYNDSRTAVLDSVGYFSSSEDLKFTSADLGIGSKRRLTVDVGGNVRLYSLDETRRTWVVSWQAFSNPCRIHGICGPNSLCTYVLHKESGRMCNCIPGHKMKNDTNWSYGCEPDFDLSLKDDEVGFIELRHVDFYGYDIEYLPNCTFERCEKKMLAEQGSGATTQSYVQVAAGFKRFTYAELKKASRNFSVEIGRGGGGVVYRGILSNQQVAAIKRLNNANQGEAEFLAEVSTIGRLNHMNLIETWGYCIEGKHRLLVCEYMEHGSLAENLHSKTLDWEKRFNIAVGTAKGLEVPLRSRASQLLTGTRGYMAPEWVFNLRITSKVDVYSYGIVMLEMVTGRSPTGVHAIDDTGEKEDRMLVKWVREKMDGSARNTSWIEEIVDPIMDGEYDMAVVELLVRVALLCTAEDKDERPTISKVAEMLLHQKSDS
ncbi:hypothetical protein F0562_027616 [Nyssa sinensis]|uniref:non-specific serine/threonine protein kinase n=1 Tax=Nyssa sinensis TaxID=561372 RepID=A0A5J5B5J1_9ASTE|nr:hypothetical protein F0562_027616 [Nyssa sinensis]